MAGHTRAPAFAPFLAYVVVFHLCWIAWPFIVYPRVTALGDATLAYALVNISLRLQVWVVPVVLYLRQVDRIEPLGYLKLRRHAGRGMSVALVVATLNLAGSVARFGPPHLSMQALTWNSVLGTSFLVATVLTSALFVAIHVPGWIALHMLTIDRAASIFIFAVVMAIVFRYSRSLWAPIIAHSANDCMSFLLFHA
jgi:CAAX protease family protein